MCAASPDRSTRAGRRLWDISPAVDEGSPVFPGDVGFTSTPTFRIGPGCGVNVAALRLSPHTGAHADAPLHFVPDGTPAGALDLVPYLGPCRVIQVLGAGAAVRPADLPTGVLEGAPPRVLFRTYRTQPTAWDPELTALAAETVELLAAAGVVLVGTDAASLDPAASKTLDAHHAAHRGGMAILENLLLDEIEPGDYELIALPLRLAGADAAPVRAVLRELSREEPR
ncbi:MAG: arylformamidase [Nocardioides sp.]|uniref:arylformamidase n=1 Tax=Nocardioides sp. TaxID=35761 RepID=UPI0039E66CED